MGIFLHFVRNFESETMPIYLTISEFLSSELEHFDTFKYSRAHFVTVLALLVTFGHLVAISEQIEGSFNTFGQFRRW